MIGRAAFLLSLFCLLGSAAFAQQAVRVPVTTAKGTLQLGAELYRPKAAGKLPAVAIFHGCGGVGVNNTRMAGLLRDWGYVALVVDSFGARHLTDVCGKHWPTEADAEERVHDIDASLAWLARQSYVDKDRLAFMGYSYGGGVALLRAFTPSAPKAAAAILAYPDCGLGEPLKPAPVPQQPTMFAMGELDDWTPVAQCQALLQGVARKDWIETHVYPGASHSFDALGLPVRYLPGVGNRSKPGGCCGAHYGASESAWKAFVADTKAFLARYLH
ncbi:MAG TPA: dienelactone hydrolase family protein [Reyranella sp.]|jgi:dienelactone hydrolase|nr:dienelactone hydrolase family protein [Reyranella sp.]